MLFFINDERYAVTKFSWEAKQECTCLVFCIGKAVQVLQQVRQTNLVSCLKVSKKPTVFLQTLQLWGEDG